MKGLGIPRTHFATSEAPLRGFQEQLRGDGRWAGSTWTQSMHWQPARVFPRLELRPIHRQAAVHCSCQGGKSVWECRMLQDRSERIAGVYRRLSLGWPLLLREQLGRRPLLPGRGTIERELVVQSPARHRNRQEQRKSPRWPSMPRCAE